MSVWSGIEVEGRLAGVPTLFVRDERSLTEAQWDYADHLYLNLSSTVPWSAHLALATEALARRKLVTLALPLGALRRLPPDLARGCHVVLVLPDLAQAPALKADDEVRLAFPGPQGTDYVLAPWSAFRYTDATQYGCDRPWEVR